MVRSLNILRATLAHQAAVQAAFFFGGGGILAVGVGLEFGLPWGLVAIGAVLMAEALIP